MDAGKPGSGNLMDNETTIRNNLTTVPATKILLIQNMPKAKHEPTSSRKQLAIYEKRQAAGEMKPFPFLKLPNEIQHMILDLALKCDKQLSESGHPDYRQRVKFRDLELLTWNRQLHAQAMPILYGRNLFCITINPLHQSRTHDDDIPHWIKDPSPDQLAYIRQVHVRIICRDEQEMSPSIQRLIAFVLPQLGKFRKVKILRITLILRCGCKSVATEVRRWIDSVSAEVMRNFPTLRPRWYRNTYAMSPSWGGWSAREFHEDKNSSGLNLLQDGGEL